MAERSTAGVLDEAKELCRARFPALAEVLEPTRERSEPETDVEPRRPVRLSLPAWAATAACGVAAAGLVVARFHGREELAAYLVLALVGTLLSAIDIAVLRIPDWLTFPSYPVVIVLLLRAAEVSGDDGRLVRAFEAAGVVGVLFLALGIFGDLGLGDVKLSGLLGLWLGYQGWGDVVWGLGLAWGFAVAWTMFLLVRGTVTRRIPMGPFLVAGVLVAVLV